MDHVNNTAVHLRLAGSDGRYDRDGMCALWRRAAELSEVTGSAPENLVLAEDATGVLFRVTVDRELILTEGMSAADAVIYVAEMLGVQHRAVVEAAAADLPKTDEIGFV